MSSDSTKLAKFEYNKKKKNKKRIVPIPWALFEKFLFAVGCEFKHQNRTSHRKYTKPGLLRPVIVPVHTKELDTFFIVQNLKTLGIDRQKYLEIMEELQN